MLQFQKFYINRTILALLQLKQPHMFRSIHLQVKLKRYLKEYPRYFSYASQNSLNLGNRFSSNIATNETEEKKINQRLLKSFVEAIAIGDLKVTDFAAVSDKFNLKDLDINYKFINIFSPSPRLLKNILFGWPLIEHSQKKIIVTSDPLDALAVNQATNGINAISLPLDFKNFSVELLEALKPFTKVIFWLDPHLHDWDTHRLLGESLKEKAFFISSKNTSSALSSLQSGHNLERILNEAKPIYHKCLATFNTYRDSVREEIQGHEKTTGLKLPTLWANFEIPNVKLEPEFTELNNTSISGTAKAIQEADNILILQTTKTRQYLQVTKNRFDGAKGCVIVEFDKNSLTFTMKKTS
ncbi:Twinkle protein like [Argiope bruennichi]|uniref:Twinkle protein like n=1 Tax=Argiope bruennichi TaxID=94029 RepID=A0A8T0EMJ4_ARGBR|nr:Twinkle protein like [Argiope bruennichi]